MLDCLQLRPRARCLLLACATSGTEVLSSSTLCTLRMLAGHQVLCHSTGHGL